MIYTAADVDGVVNLDLYIYVCYPKLLFTV